MGLGNAAATPEILARLADLLRDPHEREEAAHAVGGMMAQGVRIFKRPHGKWQGQSVAELSR
jgi:hypothetical protein